MNSFFHKAKIFISDTFLLKRIGFVLVIFAIFRLLSTIPLPGVDPFALESFLAGNQFIGLLNLFSGGGLTSLSIVMLGVGPYITASIIMQLLTVMVPRLKELYHHEGEMGRKKFNQYSRLLTLPIALIQGIGFMFILNREQIFIGLSPAEWAMNLLIVVAGAMLVTWLGELISEFGLGNGVSLIILAGIVATLPQQLRQLIFTFTPDQLVLYIGFAIVAILIIAGIVFVTEAERPVPVTYAKQARGGQVYGGTSTYIPLRVNMSGVMPLIFAISILLFPQMIGNVLVGASSPGLQSFGQTLVNLMNNGWVYSITYFVLVVVFTYFYTAITFEPESMASNLQKNGAFVPGVRPGPTTVKYIGNIVNRITFIGAMFLGLVAVIPIALQSITGIASFAIGGTSLLIVVAVLIDLFKKVDAQIAMRQY